MNNKISLILLVLLTVVSNAAIQEKPSYSLFIKNNGGIELTGIRTKSEKMMGFKNFHEYIKFVTTSNDYKKGLITVVTEERGISKKELKQHVQYLKSKVNKVNKNITKYIYPDPKDKASAHSPKTIIKQYNEVTIIYDNKNFHYDSRVKKEKFYVDSNNLKQGLCERYHDNGVIYERFFYINDIIDGLYIIYDIDGVVTTKKQYHMGNRLKTTSFRDGFLHSVFYFESQGKHKDATRKWDIYAPVYPHDPKTANPQAISSVLFEEIFYLEGKKDYTIRHLSDNEYEFEHYLNDSVLWGERYNNDTFILGFTKKPDGNKKKYHDQKIFKELVQTLITHVK